MRLLSSLPLRPLFRSSLASRHLSPSSSAPLSLALVGAPGSGKSTVSRLLSRRLNWPHLDVDDEWLEPRWKCSVAEKLRALGDEAFLRAEEEEVMEMGLDDARRVLSLTGSTPLSERGMRHIAERSLCVYLDSENETIVKRCEGMKVDRIVGQSSSSLRDILSYRQRFYEESYDVRIQVGADDSPESIVERIVQAVECSGEFVSTRGFRKNLELIDVIKRGLSEDRGLFVPLYNEMRSFNQAELVRLCKQTDYVEIALQVMERLPLGSIHPSSLRAMMQQAFSSFDHPQVLPVSALSTEQHMYLMEMWHGPTASFKDLSLQLLPRLLSHSLELSKDKSRVVLCTATSGDTGTAALDGFSRSTNNPVIVLYPRDGVSAVQRAQMLTAQGQVLVLGVKGDFDFCQTVVKDIFNDQALLKRWQQFMPNLSLSSANSINYGRFWPQIVFSFVAYIKLVQQNVIKPGAEVDLCVPTGNFGNILGAVYARKLGLPLRRLISASNENNILHDFITTGHYDLRERAFHATHSPSIDILISSNLERFLHLVTNGDFELCSHLFNSLGKHGMFNIDLSLLEKVQREVSSGWCSQQDCLATIKRVHSQTGRIIDPHTAVGVHVAESMKGDVPMLIASTANYAKFPHAVLTALGRPCDRDEQNLQVLFNKLNTLPRSDGTFIPKALTQLAHRERINDLECDAHRQEINQTIENFLLHHI